MFFDVAAKSFAYEHIDPDKLAFVASDQELSWKELKTLSDHICTTIEKINIPPGNPVLVYGDKEAFFSSHPFVLSKKPSFCSRRSRAA